MALREAFGRLRCSGTVGRLDPSHVLGRLCILPSGSEGTGNIRCEAHRLVMRSRAAWSRPNPSSWAFIAQWPGHLRRSTTAQDAGRHKTLVGLTNRLMPSKRSPHLAPPQKNPPIVRSFVWRFVVSVEYSNSWSLVPLKRRRSKPGTSRMLNCQYAFFSRSHRTFATSRPDVPGFNDNTSEPSPNPQLLRLAMSAATLVTFQAPARS
jgi:hypothetical protein